MAQRRNVIGLVPAAGHATRIGPLPGSKEIFPVGFHRATEEKRARPKAVCEYLLEKMRRANATRAYIVLRKGKWDIPAYLGDGAALDMQLAYLIMREPFGVPYTIDQAYPFVRDALVAFGFPDILFQPDDAFARLLVRQTDTQADIVLGLFPTDQPQRAEMVELDEDGRVREIVIKSPDAQLHYAWIIAVWGPTFTQYMHTWLESAPQPPEEEVTIGHIIQAALRQGLNVETLTFPDGGFLDIGTPENLLRAMRAGDDTGQLNLWTEGAE